MFVFSHNNTLHNGLHAQGLFHSEGLRLVCHEKRPLKLNRANKKSSGALVTNSLSRSQGTGSIFAIVCGHAKISTLEPLTA
jgi:hypothetical protein